MTSCCIFAALVLLRLLDFLIISALCDGSFGLGGLAYGVGARHLMSLAHCLANGADSGGRFVLRRKTQDTSERSVEPRDRGASNGVLGTRGKIEGRSGEPGEQRPGSIILQVQAN